MPNIKKENENEKFLKYILIEKKNVLLILINYLKTQRIKVTEIKLFRI
jgi:hypothetical protein